MGHWHQTFLQCIQIAILAIASNYHFSIKFFAFRPSAFLIMVITLISCASPEINISYPVSNTLRLSKESLLKVMKAYDPAQLIARANALALINMEIKRYDYWRRSSHPLRCFQAYVSYVSVRATYFSGAWMRRPIATKNHHWLAGSREESARRRGGEKSCRVIRVCEK